MFGKFWKMLRNEKSGRNKIPNAENYLLLNCDALPDQQEWTITKSRILLNHNLLELLD